MPAGKMAGMLDLTELPLGCPYCGETITVLVDPSQPSQQYIEDCQVCCRPIEIDVRIAADGEVELAARTDSE